MLSVWTWVVLSPVRFLHIKPEAVLIVKTVDCHFVFLLHHGIGWWVEYCLHPMVSPLQKDGCQNLMLAAQRLKARQENNYSRWLCWLYSNSSAQSLVCALFERNTRNEETWPVDKFDLQCTCGCFDIITCISFGVGWAHLGAQLREILLSGSISRSHHMKSASHLPPSPSTADFLTLRPLNSIALFPV